MVTQSNIKVGHIFYKNKQLVRLTQADVDDLYTNENRYEIYQPLLLTDEIFERLGISLTNHPFDKSVYYKIGPIILRWSKINKCYYFSNCKTKPHIKFIHRLQDILWNYRVDISPSFDLDSIDPLKRL